MGGGSSKKAALEPDGSKYEVSGGTQSKKAQDFEHEYGGVVEFEKELTDIYGEP